MEYMSVEEGKSEGQEMMTGKKGVAREALLVAGAILLGSLIIAGSILLLGQKGLAGTGSTGTQAAVAPTKPTNPGTPSAVTQDQIKALFTDKNITFGKKDSKVLFVEFSDPSCPFCHVAAGKNGALNTKMGPQFTMIKDGGSYIAPVPEMKKMVDSGKAGFVWLYANGHGNGEMGTKALYCAKEKGKFWEVHDLLMAEAGYNLMNNDIKNDKARSGDLANFLKSAVSVNDMKNCLDSGKYDSHLTDDMSLAQEYGFKGTPDFFVNTTNFPGAVSFKDMQSAVDAAQK